MKSNIWFFSLFILQLDQYLFLKIALIICSEEYVEPSIINDQLLVLTNKGLYSKCLLASNTVQLNLHAKVSKRIFDSSPPLHGKFLASIFCIASIMFFPLWQNPKSKKIGPNTLVKDKGNLVEN